MTTLASTGCPVATRVLHGNGSTALSTENIPCQGAAQQTERGQEHQVNLMRVPEQRRCLKATAGCISAAPSNLTCPPIRKAEATPNNLQLLVGVRQGEDNIQCELRGKGPRANSLKVWILIGCMPPAQGISLFGFTSVSTPVKRRDGLGAGRMNSTESDPPFSKDLIFNLI